MKKLMLKLSKSDAEKAFAKLAEDYIVIAPKTETGRGRFSDTDIVTYDRVESLSEIVFDARTDFSAKSVLLPIRETLFDCVGGDAEPAQTEVRPTIVFLRACDVNSLNALDAVFLKNGGYEDCHYKGRREKISIFLLECAQPFPNCFCVSMGANKTDDYSVFVRKEEDGYAVKINDNRFGKYFPAGIESQVEPHFVADDPKPLNVPASIDASLFEDSMWKEYSKRCTACGRCNTVCPTCTCFTVHDIADKDDKAKSQRRRIWSSCQIKDFGLLAGNHDFRVPKGDRMRYKVLHKVADFKKKFGFHMCVGCGRCEEVCPEYISMARCVEKINEIGIAKERHCDEQHICRQAGQNPGNPEAYEVGTLFHAGRPS